jgi:hypothetical protein
MDSQHIGPWNRFFRGQGPRHLVHWALSEIIPMIIKAFEYKIESRAKPRTVGNTVTILIIKNF